MNERIREIGNKTPSEAERRKAKEKMWRQRGRHDALTGKPRLSREALLRIGGEDAVRLYLEGYRTVGK